VPERAEKVGLKQTNFWPDSASDGNATERQRTTMNKLRDLTANSPDSADDGEPN
jgi:hypothetical protein